MGYLSIGRLLIALLLMGAQMQAVGASFEAELKWISNKNNQEYGSHVEACAWEANPNVYFGFREGACYGSSCDCYYSFKYFNTVYEDIYAQNWVVRSNTCPSGFYVTGSDFPADCVGNPQNDDVCPDGYTLNESETACNAYCVEGQSWDSTSSSCVRPETENNDCSSTGHPIDLMEGEKYRTEQVMTVGQRNPIDLQFYYRSHIGMEMVGDKLAAGRGHTENGRAYLADSRPVMSNEEMTAYLAARPEVLTDKRSFSQGYWRHSYEQWLSQINGKTIWYRPSAKPVIFGSNGKSAVYKKLQLLQLAEGGWELKDSARGKNLTFDERGRLIRVSEERNKEYLSLEYRDDEYHVKRIESSSGNWLEFSYEQYDANPTTVSGIIGAQKGWRLQQVEDNTGRKVDIQWAPLYQGRLQNYSLITSISYPYETTPAGFREYQYNDSRFGTAITDIYEQLDATPESRSLYAHFEYDDIGRAVYSGLANGVDAVSVNYLTSDSCTVTNALGKVATFTFSTGAGAKRLSSIVGEATANCGQSNVSFEYDQNGFLTSKIKNGKTTTYSYDQSRGLLTGKVEAAGTSDQKVTSTVWDAQHNLPSVKTYPDLTVEFDYNADGRVTEKREKITGVTRTQSWQYNASGRVTVYDGPRTDVNDVTTYSYTPDNQLASITNGLGQVSLITEYDALQRPVRVVDVNGVETTLSYDLQQRVTDYTVTAPSGSGLPDLTTHMEYNAAGLLTQSLQPDGTVLDYEYDAAHRLTAIENGSGERIEYLPDAAGNITEETIKNSSGTIVYQVNRAYDELSRLMDIVGAVNESAHFTYDADDNLTSATNGRNHTTTYQYDNLNRLKTVLEPLQQTTGFEYSSSGELTRVTDAETLETHYDVNGFGEVETRTSPDTGVTTYTYDEAGNVSSQTDAANGVTQYQYDALNRLTHVLYPAAPAENVVYSYDDTTDGNYGIGRLTGVTDSSGETRLTYNYLGRLIKEEYRIQNQWFTTHYQYDDYGRQVGVRYPSGRQVNLYRDSQSRVDAITTQENALAPVQAVVSNVAYLPYGPVVSWTYGNGISHQRSYDLSYRITGIQEQAGQALYNISYAYDGNSNITSLTNLINAAASQAFGYDAVDRLDSAVGNYGDIGYQYDGVGNRTGKTLTAAGSTTSETYLYQADSHRLDTVSDGTDTTQFSYDAKGNLTGRATGQQQQAWDYNTANRPQQVTTPAATVNFLHNAQGQRVYQQTAGNERYFHFGPGGQLLAVSDGAGNYQEEYLYLNQQTIAVIQPAPVTAP